MQFGNQFSDTACQQLLVVALIPLAISVCCLPAYIKLLKQYQIQQYLREEGPKSHAHKAKTPTAGGVCFWVATLLTCIGWSIKSGKIDLPIAIVLLVASICGLLGLADDMAKVLQKSNKGVSEKLRLLVETATGFALGLFVVFSEPISAWLNGVCPLIVPGQGFSANTIWLPHSPNFLPALTPDVQSLMVPPVLTIILTTFLIPATANAFNLHDGMDGLSGGTSFLVLLTMALIFITLGRFDLGVLCIITAASVLGFLFFNKYPAKVFMGDTGSLFLGGMIGALGAVGGILILYIPLTLIYIVEALSVIAQVSYYKLTKPYTPAVPISQPKLILTKLTTRLPGEGKRLFRMAPLHHHFEAVYAEKGVREWQVVFMFWLAQLSICCFVLAAFFYLRGYAAAHFGAPI